MHYCFLIVLLSVALAKSCGKNSSGCPKGQCCSYWGTCGTGDSYCGSGFYQCKCDCNGNKPCVAAKSASCTDYIAIKSIKVHPTKDLTSKASKIIEKDTTVCVTSTKGLWAALSSGGYVLKVYIKEKNADIRIKFDYKPPKDLTKLSPLTINATCYNIPLLENGSGSYELLSKSSSIFGSVNDRGWCKCAEQGSCMLKSGSKMIGLKSKYNIVKNKTTAGKYEGDCSKIYDPKHYGRIWKATFAEGSLYGEGDYLPLVPFRSVGVGRKIPYGTVLYVPDAVGTKITLPDGSTAIHDGYFIAADKGYADNTISIYVGTMDYNQNNPFSKFASSSWIASKKSFKAYVVTDTAITTGLVNLSKSSKKKF